MVYESANDHLSAHDRVTDASFTSRRSFTDRQPPRRPSSFASRKFFRDSRFDAQRDERSGDDEPSVGG